MRWLAACHCTPSIVLTGFELIADGKTLFYYSSMNAGKSTILLQSSYNYRERGMHTLILSQNWMIGFRLGK